MRKRELAEIEEDLDVTNDEDNTTNKAITAPPEPQPHALDPNVPQLPLEGALQPFTPPVKDQQENSTPDFNLMVIVLEFEGVDDQLMLAATQIESANTSSITKMAIMRKNSPKLPPAPTPTCTNCSFGNIGTLNIHIHKH